MALTLIQKSSTFKPDMIGDVVEFTTYNKTDGTMASAAGVLRSYFTGPGGLRVEFDGDTAESALQFTADELAQFNISITHYEFALGIELEEDGE